MTHAFETYSGGLSGLPDPDRDQQFYEGVPGRRLAAWFVDLGVALLIGLPLALAFGVLTLGFGFVLFFFILAGVDFLYRVTTIASGSATWGMRLMGIELRRNDGTRFDLVSAFLHTALYVFCWGFLVLQAASVVGMLGTRHGQGLPDLILRSAMINRPAD